VCALLKKQKKHDFTPGLQHVDHEGAAEFIERGHATSNHSIQAAQFYTSCTKKHQNSAGMMHANKAKDKHPTHCATS
jgi:hypothetical protein